MAVERRLNRLIQEFEDGKHEGSVMTALTVESLSLDEKQTLRLIRKEFETSESQLLHSMPTRASSWDGFGRRSRLVLSKYKYLGTI
jgi:hypothetical protein